MPLVTTLGLSDATLPAVVAAKPCFVSPATDERWMRLALEEADAASAHGDVPIGCIVVGPDGRELGRGRNRRELDQDPTAHAEIVAIRAAAAKLGHWRLSGTTLYVTLEPCAMCAGALVNSRIGRLVYGAADPKAGAVDSLYRIGHDAKLNHQLLIDEGLFRQESLARLQSFFEHLRAQGQK